MINKLQRVLTLELEKSQLLDKLEQSQKENNDLQERLNIAEISLNKIAFIQRTDNDDKIAKAQEIARQVLEMIQQGHLN